MKRRRDWIAASAAFAMAALSGCAADVAEPAPLFVPVAAPKPAPPPIQESFPVTTLPIEVLGGAGHTVDTTFNLGAQAGFVNRLRVTCSRCDYRDSDVVDYDRPKGEVSLNGGPWVALMDVAPDGSLTSEGVAAEFGGVRGGFPTVTFSVPLSGAVEGRNELAFRFNGTDGVSNGFRIIDFDLHTDAGPVLQDAMFAQDDPADWTPIRDTPLDISRGRELWEGTRGPALKVNPLGDATMRATCADCHAADGRDLKYFNYSDKSLVARARFHGLSQLQAERIASYIRSLDTPAPSSARPWNPPYQPGPNLDARPASDWAAGAGLDSVLASDADMIDEIFPNGTSNAELRRITSTRATLNAREQRLALQFPDWKMWLPEVHPVDIWGDDWADSLPMQRYRDVRAVLENGGAERMRTDPESIRTQELIKAIDRFGGSSPTFVGVRGPQPCRNNGVHQSAGFQLLGKPPTPPSAAERMSDPELCEAVLRPMLHWQLVKMWELHQEFGLEDAAPDLYPFGEARSWLGHQRGPFDLAPHRIGNDSFQFLHLTRAESSYLNTAWYQLQVVVNAGNRNPQNHRPPDWKYQMNHLFAAMRENDTTGGVRYLQTLIKMQQNLDMRAPTGAPLPPEHMPFLTDRGPTQNGWWATTHVAPWRFASIGGSFWNNEAGRAEIWDEFDAIRPGLRERLQSHMLRQWLDKTETYAPDEFPRGDTQNALSPADSIPEPWTGQFNITNSTMDHNGVYRAIQFLREDGVSETQLERLRLWGQTMWPDGDWDALRVE